MRICKYYEIRKLGLLLPLSLDEIRRFRTLTLIAIFSDDDLMDTLVLKGGNALELGYGFNSRASIDLDFSMAHDFSQIGLTDLDQVRDRLEKVLSKTFIQYGYQVFEVRIKAKPKRKTPETAEFWAGYEANFKIIEHEKFEAHKDEPVWLAAKSIAVSETKKNITIDFGRHEYLGDITMADLEGFIIPIYTPTLIVLEKIRAICQQMGDYLVTIGKDAEFGKPRPRDFYDIYTVLESPLVDINFGHPEIIRHLRECFKAKRVPLSLISKISETKEFHKQDENRLRESILNKKEFKGFDFYFDYVVGIIQQSDLHRIEEVA